MTSAATALLNEGTAEPWSRLKLVRVDGEQLRHEVLRFRYDVYVRLMGRRQVHADHQRQIIEEPLDQRGENFAAVLGGRIVGTIRRNFADDPSCGYYRKLYRAHLFGTERLSAISLTTKLMVLPEYRGTTTALRLIRDYAEEGYRQGVQVDLIDCNSHLIPFFEKLGYFCYGGWTFHKEYGSVMPMFLAVDMLGYLAALRSVLSEPAARYLVDDQYGGTALVHRLARLPRNRRVRGLAQSWLAIK